MILENYRRNAYGGGTQTTENGTSTYDAPVGVQALYRSGTGRRRKPAIPDNTPYERKSETITAPRGTGSWVAGSQFNRWTGFLPQYLTTNMSSGLQSPSTFDSNYSSMARLKAMDAFDQRDFDLGTAWAERGKTADLVTASATTMVKALDAIRRRNGRELLTVLNLDQRGARGKGVVDAYLAYHYGVVPLLHDVAGAVQSLTRLPSGQWTITASEAHAGESKKTTLVGLGSFYPYNANSHLRKSARAIVTATERPLTREKDVAWSLGLDNPLGTAWELTPYSFVVDWMFPIGDYIQALNSSKYYTGWQTVLTEYMCETVECTSGSGTVSGFIVCKTSISPGVYKTLWIKRAIVDGFPLRGLPIKDPRSVDHMAKALSLLASASAGAGNSPRFIRY